MASYEDDEYDLICEDCTITMWSLPLSRQERDGWVGTDNEYGVPLCWICLEFRRDEDDKST